MGKRKKIEVKLSDQELVPSTIGYLEENKKGFIGLILIFIVFIGVAVFMPQINDYVNKYLGKTDSDTIIPEKDSDKNNQNPVEKTVMYDMNETLEFEYNKLKFSKFKISSGYLSFNIENTTEDLIDFGINRYYIETYSSDSTLLERHIFNSNKLNPTSMTTQNVKLIDGEESKISKIEISSKSEKDYPEVVLQINSNNENILTCNDGINSIEYTYDKDNKLLKIKDIVNYKNDKSATYSNNLTVYQSRVSEYNNKEGVSSSLVEISTGFMVTTEIDAKKADLSGLNNENYYDSKTLPKVVRFEMESRGFSCK